MKILVSGSHGLVGKALSKSLSAKGHEIYKLVRERSSEERDIEWRPEEGTIDIAALEGFDALVHLAGENIASGRWTDEKKRRIRESRVRGTSLLSQSLSKLSNPPATFVSASAIGYYGNRGDELLSETSAPGTDFLASVCKEWEQATVAASEKGVRVVMARFGIILDAKDGALAKMLTPFRMGVGGKIGDGKQWMSWIALDDVVNGLEFVLENRTLSGPVNFVAPRPVRNAEFTKALGRALHRPTWFPVPAFIAETAFGEMGDALLLSSQRVEPRTLTQAGFKFSYSDIDAALSHVLKSS